jgi:hypothetical protein
MQKVSSHTRFPLLRTAREKVRFKKRGIGEMFKSTNRRAKGPALASHDWKIKIKYTASRGTIADTETSIVVYLTSSCVNWACFWQEWASLKRE